MTPLCSALWANHMSPMFMPIRTPGTNQDVSFTFFLFSFHFKFGLISNLSKCTKATVHLSKIDGWHLLHKSYVSYLLSPLNGLLGVLYRSIWGTSSIV